MKSGNGLSRRAVVKNTLVALAGADGAAEAVAAQKKPGETRGLFLLGDYCHNPAMRPANISLGWSPDKIVEKRPEPDVFMTPAHETMIVKNVRRGMGLVAVHCAVWNPDSRQYLDLLGVEKPVMHGPVVSARIFELNPEHPITKGIQPFNIGIDEVFHAVMKPGQHTQLFRSSQEQPKRNAIGGWCREEGSGRVVALLPGHTTGPYGSRQFLDMMRRSAHWALKREIPPLPADVFTARI